MKNVWSSQVAATRARWLTNRESNERLAWGCGPRADQARLWILIFIVGPLGKHWMILSKGVT